MVADDELKIKITVDGNQAVTGAKQVQTSLKGVGDEAEKSSSKLDKLAAAGKSAAVAIGAVITAKTIKSLADLGDEIQDAREGLDSLAKQAGTTGDAITQKLDGATKGALTNLEKFQLANRGLQLGIKPEDLDNVAAAAQRYSERFGGDVPAAMEKLIQSLATGREAQLRFFGTVKDGSLVLDGYNTSVEGISDSGNVLAATFQDLKGKLGELFNDLDGVAHLVQDFTGFVQVLGESLLAVLKPALEAVDAVLRLLSDGIRATIQDFQIIGKQVQQFSEGGIFAVSYTKALRDVIAETEKTKAKTEDATPAIIRFGKGVSSAAKEAEKAKKQLKEFNDQLFRELFPTATTFPIELYNKHLDTLQKALEAGKEGSAAFNAVINEQAAAWEKAGGKLEDYIRDLQQTKQVAEQTQGGIIPTTTVGSSDTKSIGLEIGQAIAEGIGDALKIAFSKGSKSDDWGQALGSVAGKTANIAATAALKETLGDFAPVAGEIAGALVGELTTALADAFGGKDTPGTTARKAADKWFAELFDAERLAVVVKGQVQRLDDLVFKGQSPFGGNISGFAKDNNGFAALSQLNSAAQGQFNAVGSALEQLLGVASDISGQIAAMLVNNIGGSLENLQILVQQTGFSFEEMSNAIVESFYAGQLSIQETANALANLQGIFETGIPGAIGAVDEAWANFEASVASGSGSRILIDSIRDIGAEAQELGITSFPQLADQMVRVFGFSANQVAAFFEAMKAVGIQSIQELINASTQDLINMAANYQQILQGLAPGFGPAATDPQKISAPRQFTSPRAPSLKGSKSSDTLKDSFDANKESIKILNALYQKFSGNLSAVGAAAQAVGVTFDTMNASITNAFKAGKIGAEDALKRFNKFKDSFSNGIAGKTGAVGEAIQNLIKTGAEGGVLTLNAFKGILTEAKEGRVSTLGGLVDIFRQQLGGGASDKLREALKGEGINSFKELQSASEDTIVRILGNLEKLGFPFEQTTKKTKDLLKQINKIGDAKPQEIKVILKVKAETDGKTDKLLKAIPAIGKAVTRNIRTGEGIELQ